jgi:hypothetical protein
MGKDNCHDVVYLMSWIGDSKANSADRSFARAYHQRVHKAEDKTA